MQRYLWCGIDALLPLHFARSCGSGPLAVGASSNQTWSTAPLSSDTEADKPAVCFAIVTAASQQKSQVSR